MENNKLSSNIKNRKIKDNILNSFTGISSFISVIILFAIILFIGIRGVGNFDLKMITSDYYETPYFAEVTQKIGYSCTKSDENGVYLSHSYAIVKFDNISNFFIIYRCSDLFQ